MKTFPGSPAACGLTILLAVSGLLQAEICRGQNGDLDLDTTRRTIARLGLRYTVAENWVTRLDPYERRLLGGARVPDDPALQPDWQGNGRTNLQAAWDWRDIAGDSYVSGVRNQGACGSCWDFAALAMLESALMIALDQPNTDPDYSEQYVLSCINITGFPSSCGGGYLNAALEFLRLAGAPLESCFWYEGHDELPCGFSCPETTDLRQILQSWSYVTTSSLNIDTIKNALASGPVGTWFKIYNSFYGYADGVYSAYGSTYTGGNHFVLIVGYDDGEQCWIAKNSWGPSWGEGGYFRIAYDSGCDFGLWTQACSYAPSWPEVVAWSPENPSAGDSLAVRYDPSGRSLQGAGTVWIHRGHNGWQGITDEAMSWNGADAVWETAFPLAEDAFSSQWVFHDGSGLYDNNGGADWTVPITFESPYFVMDGYLDGQAWSLGSDGDLSLWGRWLGPSLYLATTGTGGSPYRDHFLLVVTDPTAIGPAPWDKAGTCPVWAYFLGAENDNGWSGWFDPGSTVMSGSEFATAQGPYLEGRIDLEALFGGDPPDTVWVAAAAYRSPDGGSLQAQAPAGNGNLDLEIPEFVPLFNPTTGLADHPSTPRPWRLSVHPNPFNPGADVLMTLGGIEAVRLEVFDLEGRRVATIHHGPAGPGLVTFHWDGRNQRGESCASGVYFFRIQGLGTNAVTKAMLLK
jgi:hypothetical protein